MRITIFILYILLIINAYGQNKIINKVDITPKGILQIGGVSYYNDQLFLLLSTNILYQGKEAEAYEANIISQKYQVWDIYAYDPATGKLENRNKQWKTNGASPNGFSIVDNSTVVYINTKNQLESNNKKLNANLQNINQSKAYCTDPFYDAKQGRFYFSSDYPSGKGNLNIWFVDTKGGKTWRAINAGNINTPFNEISPSVINDSLLVYSSEKRKKQYDICFYNIKLKKLINRDETPNENEYFTLMTPNGTIYYITQNSKNSTLWKGSLQIEKKENIENISTVKIDEISIQPNYDAGLEKIPEINHEEPNIGLTNYFGLAKYDLNPFMKDSLNKLADLLKINTNLNITICGHASPDGPENLNMMLSYYRANEAYKWLVNDQVDPGRIFRIFGGEYLFSDTIKARMFSIFTVTESDLPEKLVVYRLGENETKNDLLKRFGADIDKIEYAQSIIKKQLPIDGENILMLPINEIHIVQNGESIVDIAKMYNIDTLKIIKANNLPNEPLLIGKIIFIPLQK